MSEATDSPAARAKRMDGAVADTGRDGTPAPGEPRRFGHLVGAIWLLTLAYPLANLLHTHPSPLRLLAGLAGIVAFAGVYISMTSRSPFRGSAYRGPLQEAIPTATGGMFWAGLATLVAIAGALTLINGQAWLVLLIFASARAGAARPPAHALLLVSGLALLTATLGWLTSAGWSDTVQVALLVLAAGLVTRGHARLAASIQALRAAQEEIARLAVAEERLRFARDLHDLLGHTLSLIALKSELARQLVSAAPNRAVAEIGDVEAVARQALQEVREAVAGYRQPSLASELRAAQELLAAADIAFICEGETGVLPPTAEAALSWAVREGVTNVIRHSRAHQCAIRVRRSPAEVAVEITDDGLGPRAAPGPLPTPDRAGWGLAGLAERVVALGGHCETGLRPGSGFRLYVSLPIERPAGYSAGRETTVEDTAEQVVRGGNS